MKVKLLHSRTAYGNDKPHIRKEKVEMLYSASAYGNTCKNVNKENQGSFIHPVINNVGKYDNITNLLWSNTKANGHYGIPKLIAGTLREGIFIDWKGEYAITQNCFAIIDEPENFEQIKKAMKSQKFLDLMSYCVNNGSPATKYNYRIIRELRHDFWKEFVENK